jgi:hypothetical protein
VLPPAWIPAHQPLEAGDDRCRLHPRPCVDPGWWPGAVQTELDRPLPWVVIRVVGVVALSKGSTTEVGEEEVEGGIDPLLQSLEGARTDLADRPG